MKERTQFIGGKSGGIDAAVFKSSKNPEFTPTWGKSGDLFNYRTTPESIHLLHDGDNETGFSAEVKNGVLNFWVDTRDEMGNRHPDLYAKKLFLRSIQYFKDQGTEVRTIEGVWLNSAMGLRRDNHDQYYRFLNGLEKPTEQITDEDRKKAALSTWTGHIATELGYSEVASVVEEVEFMREDTYVDIKARFVKPQEKKQQIDLEEGIASDLLPQLDDQSIGDNNTIIDWSGQNDSDIDPRKTL